MGGAIRAEGGSDWPVDRLGLKTHDIACLFRFTSANIFSDRFDDMVPTRVGSGGLIGCCNVETANGKNQMARCS